MRIQRKNVSAISIYALITLFTATSTFASQPSAVNFSPYADLTINASWSKDFNDMEPMDLTAISKSTGINEYHLAFITDSGNCKPAWGGQDSYSVSNGWASHLTDKMRANSINYIISFGGASGSDISMSCNESQLIATFEQVVKTYQPRGLDFDIENGSANVSKLLSALTTFQHSHPDLKISFTLPVMPEGLLTFGTDLLKQAKSSQLNYSVNIMAMDYGPAYVNDMGQYAIQAATNLFTFLKGIYPEKSDPALWKMVEVTSMIGVNDVNVEQFTLKNVDALRHFARENHLGSLAMWSIARDNPCADKWASPICSGNNLQATSYEFSKRFIQ